MKHIMLDETDFEKLTKGEVIQKDDVKIALQDIGYDNMLDIYMTTLVNFMMKNKINKMSNAVVIEVSEDLNEIVRCDPDFRHGLMNGNYPEDNFDNCDYIPKEYGTYQFDIEYNGGEDLYYGESTEYWYECFLRNCKKINKL